MPNKTDAGFSYRLLKLIEQRPEISQRELAGELGLSLGKVNNFRRMITNGPMPIC